MATLKDIAEHAKVSILTAYYALSETQPVEPAIQSQVRAAAAAIGYKLNVTLRDVAALANVSVATVSYVLNNSAPVSQQTSRRVMDAVTVLGYRPNVTAKNLKTSKTRMIGYAWHPAYPEGYFNALLNHFIYAVTMSAEACGYRILTFVEATDNRSAAYEELIYTNHVDGFILSNTNSDDARIRRLMEMRFPFAAFGRANDSWSFPYVDVDGRAGIRLATEHLLSQGHERIAILGWPEGSLTGDERLHGYIDAMTAAHINLRSAWIVRTLNSVRLAYQETEKLIKQSEDERPTAIVALTDLMAIGVMRAIEDAGLRIGHDIAVTGFDDDPMATFIRPSLTTLRQPIDALAGQMIDMLMTWINEETQPSDRHFMFIPELIVRESSQTALHSS
ncbi:MAG: LacI family DNA-binding transcriptional regulator [Anaerolineae bacterium]|nr:LacI family DNA-binding transcriptional regulator [Anaerolineae bacterium]